MSVDTSRYVLKNLGPSQSQNLISKYVKKGLIKGNEEFEEEGILGHEEEVPTQTSEIQEGQYVDVFLYGKNGRQSFRGIVDEIDSGELLVRFMKAVGEGLYVWPEKDDKAFVPLYDVIKTLKPPSLVARGRYQFGERKHTKVKCSADDSLLLLSDSTIEFIESAVEEVPTQSSEIQETQSSAEIQEGQYVDVYLYGKNGRQSFRGIVDEIDSGEL